MKIYRFHATSLKLMSNLNLTRLAQAKMLSDKVKLIKYIKFLFIKMNINIFRN